MIPLEDLLDLLKLQFPEFAREAAKTLADIYNRWRIRLPPKQNVTNEKVG